MVQLQSLQNSVESLRLTAVIDTALCVGAGGSTGSLADKPIIRNAQNQLVIPASQLKGRLRHECEKLARALRWAVCESPNPNTMCSQHINLLGRFDHDGYQARVNDSHHCLICQIFGNPSLRSQVQFDDLICSNDPESLSEVLRPGVTISRSRRTAEEQKLYFLETSPANAELAFVGQIHFQADCKPWMKALLLSGLHHIHALGGSKSAGLGWLQWQIESETIGQSAWDFLKGGESP
ncbi:CRISPR-associated protein Csm3 [Pseudanabaenaceae cyanobacterium LEGE 13415]|nr:CRISPR-associated protein Csm3 [Pseudanabaenaceae cyanobacterium LEGE 13415]